MAASFKDLFNSHLKYIEFLISKTHLSHQYLKDIKNAGGEVEIELREILSQLLPKRFKITHGFICFTFDNRQEPLISPQLDLIIVDTLVAHSLFPLSNTSGQEVVPLEAVVGILEIKRNLDKESLQEAVQHLKKTCDYLKINKFNQTQYLTGGMKTEELSTGIYSNPILAVLSIKHELNPPQTQGQIDPYYASIFQTCDEIGIDLIGSLSGFCILTMSQDNQAFQPYVYREKDRQYTYGFISSQDISINGIISRIFGFIIAYLSLTSGKMNNMSKYFFHRSNWEK